MHSFLLYVTMLQSMAVGNLGKNIYTTARRLRFVYAHFMQPKTSKGFHKQRENIFDSYSPLQTSTESGWLDFFTISFDMFSLQLTLHQLW